MALSLEFKITRNVQLLDEYYQLRERCFRADLGLVDFDGSEEEQDKCSKIMVALLDGRCVGGVRISAHIVLSSQLELLGLRKESCCMWERFAIEPAMRTLSFFLEFTTNMVSASCDAGYKNAMILSSLLNARFYRRCHTALGVEFHIHRHVPHCAHGVFSGLEHYLSVAHLERKDPVRVAV
jgi:hypothetical protein